MKIKIRINNRTISGAHPTKWEEVNAKNFVSIARFFNGDVMDPARRIVLFFDLMALKTRQRRRLPELSDESPEDIRLIEAMLNAGNFLSETPAPDKWFIPFVRIGLKKYFAPRPTLAGSSFREFIYADTLYQQFFQSQSGEIIWQLASVLYRRRGKEKDDLREPFVEGNFNAEAAKWKTVNGYIPEAIFYNYKICRSYIEQMYPRLFPVKEQKPDEETEPTPPPSEPIWLSMLDALCDGDLAKMREYEESEVHSVLRLMNNAAEKRH